MSAYIGEIAALGTSVCWGFTSIFFSKAGRLVGSPVVNRTRLLLAVILVSIFHLITQGELIPLHAEPERWGWLGFSAIFGFIVGDAFLFQAFVLIGPRLSMLLMALSPVFSVILGWTLLGENLTLPELIGISCAVGGVIWVVMDRTPQTNEAQTEHDPRRYTLGLLCGMGGAIGQAIGLIASKQGLHDDFPALSGNLIRLIVATILIWLFTIGQGQATSTFEKLQQHPSAIYAILIATVAGPFLGVWFSLIAVQKAPVGIASTLTSLTPIILLPVSYFIYKEQLGLRTVMGTILAVAGTAIIFLAV